MTDLEFDIVDELYFVTSYEELHQSTGIDGDQLNKSLFDLVSKGWVRIYKSMDEASEIEPEDFRKSPEKYYYLASKTGLMKHNSK